jgi:hypothetical protein
MRRGDWESALAEYLGSVRDEPHSFGKHDCLIFVAGAIKAMTGKDYARGHRGKYKSAASAKRYLKGLGFDNPAAMISAHLEEKPVTFAQRGDVVADQDGIPGIVLGGEAAFVGAEGEREGLIMRPRAEWTKAWGV